MKKRFFHPKPGVLIVDDMERGEAFLQARHLPAARGAAMSEAAAGPQVASCGVIHRCANGAARRSGIAGAFGAPVAAFMSADDGLASTRRRSGQRSRVATVRRNI